MAQPANDPQPRQDRDAFSVKEVARILGIPPSTLYDLVKRAQISSVRYGKGPRKRVRIEATAIQEFLDCNRIPAQDCSKRAS